MTTLRAGRSREGTPEGAGRGDGRNGTFDALGHRFAVACEDRRLTALAQDAFALLAACGPPTGWYRIGREADGIDVTWKDRTIGVVADWADALSVLRVHVQHSAIAAADSDIVLRAGAVELDGRTLVISGAPGCGVSTLVAALVAEGCTYLSDDATPVETWSGRVRPFPQPVLLDDRSLDLLPDIGTLLSGTDSASGRRVVSMHLTQAKAGSAPREVTAVLFPERDDSGITLLHPMDHDNAVMRLAEHSYNFPGHDQEAIAALHWLVRDAVVFTVVGGDPYTSARAVLETLARS